MKFQKSSEPVCFLDFGKVCICMLLSMKSMPLRDSMKYDALVKCFESDLRSLKKPWL